MSDETTQLTESQLPDDAEGVQQAAPAQPVRVSLRCKSVPVEVELPVYDKETGQMVLEADGQPKVVVKRYTVREMSGLQRDEYLNRQKRKIKMVDGKAVVDDFDKFYALLLSYTLYDETGKLVPAATIQTYPNEAQEALHAVADSLNAQAKGERAKAEAES